MVDVTPEGSSDSGANSQGKKVPLSCLHKAVLRLKLCLVDNLVKHSSQLSSRYVVFKKCFSYINTILSLFFPLVFDCLKA